MTVERQLIPIDRQESLRLVAGVPLGRVVFTDQALPAIRPVNHIIDGDDVIIRTHLGSAVAAAVSPGDPGVVVAYEADQIDLDKGLGWSVVVTGIARAVVDAEDVARYEALLEPWISQRMDHVIRIVPDIVSGFWLTDGVATRP